MYRPGCSESYNLEYQFPNLCINEHQMCIKIASPCQKFKSSQGLWEIETKPIKLFRKNYWRWGTIGKASWFFWPKFWLNLELASRNSCKDSEQNCNRILIRNSLLCLMKKKRLESTRIWKPTANYYLFDYSCIFFFWKNYCCSLIGYRLINTLYISNIVQIVFLTGTPGNCGNSFKPGRALENVPEIVDNTMYLFI